MRTTHFVDPLARPHASEAAAAAVAGIGGMPTLRTFCNLFWNYFGYNCKESLNVVFSLFVLGQYRDSFNKAAAGKARTFYQ